MSPDRSFLIAQADTTQPVPYRVLWISAVESPEGLSFQPNTTLLAQDTSKAERFLYGNGRFRRPSGLAFAADGTNYIFMTDAATDSLHIFQTSGVEGIRRPGAPSSAKAVIASFGGRGTGPRQFNKPSGVAYFRRVVYVADRDNNRICRFKLNTDFE
jgi:DNA-binding beta-propeller fold protein YncE